MEFIKNIFISFRPKQWVKNTFIFAALIFVREFYSVDKIILTVEAFFLFCLASSAIYLFNDIVDLPRDREHPFKKLRPLASGKVKIIPAIITTVLLLVVVLVGGFYLNFNFGLSVAGYLVLNALYTFWLKHIVIVDVLVIALGFVLRVVAGATAIGVTFSPWLVFCTFFLTLFLAISKRKNELIFLSNNKSRSVLSEYSLDFINQMNMIVLPLTLITYTFYTFSSEHSRLLMLTVPIVSYGMFRYLFILQRKKNSDDGPTDDLFSDRGLQFTVLLWIAVVIFVLVYQR